jgi:alkylation response protein AidB-like acyl-CoA dehydrogenase
MRSAAGCGQDERMIATRAQEIADDVLFPAALAVDAADRVPPSHFDLLAAEGFYGAPLADDVDLAGLGAVVEALASGDLATAFVWIQHLTPLMAAVGTHRADLAAAFAAGERRGGIALAGLRSPHHPMGVRATEAGFVLTGAVPWVTGWDMIDTIYVAARDPDDVIHYLFVDAVRSESLTASEPLELVAVQASRTVNLTFDDHFVRSDRLARTQPFAEWAAEDSGGSTLNGFLSLGVAGRCCRLIGPSRLDDELVAARSALLAADPAATPAARAQASELAIRAASALAVSTGSRAVLRDQHAQRLIREAAFLLVFGSRPPIKQSLLARLIPSPA